MQQRFIRPPCSNILPTDRPRSLHFTVATVETRVLRHARLVFVIRSATISRMQYHVYILASHRKTLYTGVTSNLTRRLSQHAEGRGSQFAAKYNVNRLVFAEEAPTRMEAVAREKQIKRWRREKKLALIESINPQWVDLTNTPL